MPTVTTTQILLGVLQYGPQFVVLVQRLMANIKAGKGNDAVTPEDLVELTRLAGQTSADIYLKVGVNPLPTSK